MDASLVAHTDVWANVGWACGWGHETVRHCLHMPPRRVCKTLYGRLAQLTKRLVICTILSRQQLVTALYWSLTLRGLVFVAMGMCS
jgi:hypothetical protein